MDRTAVFNGHDAPASLFDRPDGPDGPDRPDRPNRPDAARTQQPATTPLDILSSASSSFQSNGGYRYAQQPPTQPYSNTTTSGSDSQDAASSTTPTTASSTDADRMHTPPGTAAAGSGPEHDFSSQESQLLQLSNLAATRERMANTSRAGGPDLFGAGSRKRTADGSVKHTRNASSASPMYIGGHSRNTSTVSLASTTGSRIGELSAELKARLSYAMVKVNNGWHAHSIDQVENLASQAGSPTSSTSTIHGRQAASVSPRIPGIPGMPPSHKRQLSQASQASVSTASTTLAPSGREPAQWPSASSSAQPPAASSSQSSSLASSRGSAGAGAGAGVVGVVPPPRSLAPPATIQAARPRTLARRRSDTTPAAFSAAHHPALHAGPHTPGEPMLFSPDQNQNVREQDAIETLLFMSSPGNSANMKHFPSFVSASQPSGHHDAHQRPVPPPTTPMATTTTTTTTTAASPQRHALPTVPRRALPTPLFYNGGGGGHRRSPSDMMDVDVDDAYGSGGGTPRSVKGTPRRRANGNGGGGTAFHAAESNHHSHLVSPRRKVPLPLAMPSGLSVPSKPRPLLAEEDIDRLLDRAAAAADDDSSDSDSEILIPARPTGPVGM